MVEEPLFLVGSGAIAAQRAVGSNDAVARHNDADGVDVVGLSHSTERTGMPCVQCLVPVTLGLPVRDALQFGPRLHLEVGARQVQRQRELTACAGKILLQLLATVLEQGSGAGT